MKTYNASCVVSDKKQQLRIATYFFRQKFSLVKMESINLYEIHFQCQCGCLAAINCNLGFREHKKLGILEVLNLTMENIGDHYGIQCYNLIGKRQQDDTRMLLSTLGNSIEVILLDSSLESPLCSVLTSAGILHNVIDTDWSGFSNIGGNQQK